jgi:hypothetical protein
MAEQRLAQGVSRDQGGLGEGEGGGVFDEEEEEE